MTPKRLEPSIEELLRQHRAKPKVPEKPKDPREFWTLMGTGSMGLKAERLYDTSKAQQESGFTLNPRIVLRMDWFLDFKKRCGVLAALKRGADHEELQARVMAGTFSEHELRIIRFLAQKYRGTPLAVRSSAHGDSRGTGIYHSGFCLNMKSPKENLEELVLEIKKVLASEFSRGAIAFRKDMKLEDGMAVIIEPVFGQRYVHSLHEGVQYQLFAPTVSGFGYTSTAFGSGYVRLIFGMPEGAINGDGIIIGFNDEHANESLGEYTHHSSRILLHTYIAIGATVFDLESGEKRSAHEYSDCASEYFNLAPLISGIRDFEQRTGGNPKYLEWAARVSGDFLTAQEISLLQVADMTYKTDFVVFPKTIENIIFEGYDPLGEGIKKCRGINICSANGPGSYWFNQTHKDYVLVVPSAYLMEDYKKVFNYASFNNAAIIIVVKGSGQRNKPLSEHFRGLGDVTNKLFLVIDYNELGPEAAVRFVAMKMGKELPMDKPLHEMDLEFEALVSRKQGNGFVRLL